MTCKRKSPGKVSYKFSHERAMEGLVAEQKIQLTKQQSMKKLTKLAVLSVGAAFVSTAAQAQLDNGDLILGFTSQAAGVTSDYVVDLGTVPGSQNSALDTSGFVQSDFNTTFGSAFANGAVNVGIAGGIDSSTAYVFTSVLDDGTGTATVPGSTAPTSTSKSFVQGAAGTLGSVNTGIVSFGSGFTANVAQSPTAVGTAANSFSSYTGFNPLTTIPAGASTVTLDVFEDVSPLHGTSTTVSYVGDVTLDFTGSGLTATYDAAPVPEPTTNALLAGAGVLAFAFRRQFIRKNA